MPENYKFNLASANVNGTGIGSYHMSERPDVYEPSRNHAFEFVLNSKLNTLLAAKRLISRDKYPERGRLSFFVIRASRAVIVSIKYSAIF